MPTLSRREFLLGAAALAAAGGVPAWLLLGRREGPVSQTNSPPEHVILVDWDGFDPAYLDRTPTPNIDALAARGSLSTAKSTFQTLSNPARASMSTGAYPEVHGNASYYYDGKTGEAIGETRFLAAETIAEVLAAAGKTAVSVQWYMVEDHGTSAGDPDHLYVQPDGPFQSRVDAAVEVLNRRPVSSGGRMVTVPKVPDFLAVYGSDLDALGSREGPDSPNIGPLLAEMDRQLGRIVQAARDAGIYEKTAFILTSDHGMTTWNRSLLDEAGRLTATGYRVEVVPVGRSAAPDTEVILVPDATRTAQVTLRGRAATPEGRRRIRTAFEDAPHVGRVLGEAGLKDLRASGKLGDFVVEAEPPWAFVLPDSTGSAHGAHGSTREMAVPLLLSGAGIRRAAAPRNAGIVDVAPTISALLNTRPPADAQGRALTESLVV